MHNTNANIFFNSMIFQIAVVREALKAKEEGTAKTILFNLSGHGHFDMAAYEDYFSGKLVDHELSYDELHQGLNELNAHPLV